MKRLTIGIYYPTKTYLHQIDARVKVMATFMAITLLFNMSFNWHYLAYLIGLLLLIKMVKIPFNQLRSLLMFRYFFIIALLIGTFILPGEDVIFSWWQLTGTTEGFIAALAFVLRVFLMILTTTILTLTTTPHELTHAFESLLSPLKKIKVPVSECALMIQLALRFVPTILEEILRITNAQKARGVCFEEKGLFRKMKQLIPIVIPLILLIFKRADLLAQAMDARNYKVGKRRSSFHLTAMNRKTYIQLSFVIIVFISLLLLL